MHWKSELLQVSVHYTIAMALPANGKLVACDISEEWTSIGKPFWNQANVGNKIDLRIGPAIETLKEIKTEFGENSFDLAFIDADEISYDLYYEVCLQLIRPNGVIILDNTLQGGHVTQRDKDEATEVVDTLNLKIRDDNRVSAVLLTLGDGMTVVRKR
jgi:predicted O-methyltransferase YrrM